jgi:hypothetical protein
VRFRALLLYGLKATFVWFLLSLSAWLSHLRAIMQNPPRSQRPPTTCFSIERLAVLTRLLENMLAILNGTWVVILSFLQFTNVYNNCWCSASAFQWGTNSWVLLFATLSELFVVVSQAWAAGTFLGLFCALVCGGFFVFAKGDDLFRMEPQWLIGILVIQAQW